jgi:hypothetical protein
MTGFEHDVLTLLMFMAAELAIIAGTLLGIALRRWHR